MRRIAILCAALLVLAPGALLVAPRFVDPDRYREAITAALARATGRQVTIAGPLALTLLPVPSLSAADVRVAGIPGAARPDMLRAAHIEARLAWVPLLGGRLVLRNLVLAEPVLDLASLPLRAAPRKTSPNEPATASHAARPSEPVIAIERLSVTNGTIIGSEHIEGIYLDASMADAGGPAHGAGRLTLRGARLDFDLDVDRIGERTPFRLQLRMPAAAAQLAFAGELVAPPNGEMTVEGKAKLTGEDFAAVARLAHEAAPPALARPFSATATLTAGRNDIRLDALSFAVDEMHGTGALHIAPGAPSFALTMMLNQIDLDRLAAVRPTPRSAAPAGARPTAQPPARPSVPGRTGGAAMPATPLVPNGRASSLKGQIDLAVEALRWRGGVIRNARLHAALDHGAVEVSRIAASLPGGSDLSLSGTLDAAAGQAGGQRQFRGAVELESDNLRLLLDWLGARTAGIPADRLRKLTLSGQFTARPGQIDIGSLDLTVDATRLTGAATVALRRRIAIGARLAVDQLNIDAYLPASGPAAAAQPSAPRNPPQKPPRSAPPNSAARAPPTDYAALLAAFDANIDATIDSVTWRGQPARGVRLAATLEGGDLTLREATIADIAGAGATVRGALTGIGGDDPAWHAAVTMQGPEIAHLVRLIAPDSTLGSMLSGNFNAKSDIAGERGGVALDLDLAALGGKLRLTGEVADSAANAPGADLGIEISHPSFVGLLRNMMPGYQPAGGDPGAVKLSGKFSEAKGLLSVRDMSLSIGGLLVEGDTILARRGGRPKLTADLRFNELALDRFLPARRTAAREDRPFTCGAPSTCAGTIVRASTVVPDAPVARRWSREAFDLTPLAALDADLSVTGDGFSWDKWRIERPIAAVTLDDGLLRVNRLSGGVFGGTIEATGQLAAADGQAKAEIAIRHAALEQALRDAAGIGNLAGRVDVDASLATAGLSDAALVAHLQGSGRLTSRDGTIAGIDLPAIGARLDAANGIADLPGLLHGLSGGKTRYRTLDGTFRVTDGIIQSDDLHLVAESGEGHATATLDLPKWLTHDHLELRLGDHGALPPLAMTLDGTLDAPHIVLDVNALESYLAQRRAAQPTPKQPATEKPSLRDQLKPRVR